MVYIAILHSDLSLVNMFLSLFVYYICTTDTWDRPPLGFGGSGGNSGAGARPQRIRQQFLRHGTPPSWLLFCFLGCLRDGFVKRTKRCFNAGTGRHSWQLSVSLSL